ncbi:MAG TPA: hypothetical protein VGS04_00510 [Nitrososphaerales archaeon]|nr:hypothetical protein [Nitrososphaerales archaeon]
MRRGGFFAGAVGGLALALLLIGLASLLPQTSNPLDVVSTQHGNAQSASTTLVSTAPVASKSSNSSAQSMGAPSVAQVAGNGAAAASSSSETTTSSASASSVASSAGNIATPGLASSGGVQAQQKPSSLLAVLPGESVGSLIATVSPLLIGLLVAALFYGAYARRQDSGS